MSDSKFEDINRLSAEGAQVKVKVNGKDATALINTGHEPSIIDIEFAESLGVEIIPAGPRHESDGSFRFYTATGCHVEIAIPSANCILPSHPVCTGRFSREVGGKTIRDPYDLILSRDALQSLRFVYDGMRGRFSLDSG